MNKIIKSSNNNTPFVSLNFNMGNCCRWPHEKRSDLEFEDEELILGDSPGVPPAVLLNICYWDTSQPTTGGASTEEEVEEAGLNFDKIIIALKDVKILFVTTRKNIIHNVYCSLDSQPNLGQTLDTIHCVDVSFIHSLNNT